MLWQLYALIGAKSGCAVGLCKNRLKKDRRDLTKVVRKAEATSRKENFQKLFDQKQKLANAIINNTKGEKVEPDTLRGPSGTEILYRQEDVLAETQRYYTELNRPPAGVKNQQYLPATVPREYPWAQQNALDSFQLETHVGQEAYKFINLDDHIRDQTAFQQCLRNTKLGKSPGPDQVTNELLRYLPVSMQDALHKFMILMWMTGSTPTRWKESETLLLYKKGDPLLLSNYRPIALANAVYKVWTGLLTMAMSRYAEHFHILSEGQEGFRKHRNTMRSLQSLLNVYEDARLSTQNVYAVYIDYSNAFNTINQDKLLQVLFDLGFPNVAIDAVKGIYCGAMTRTGPVLERLKQFLWIAESCKGIHSHHSCSTVSQDP